MLNNIGLPGILLIGIVILVLFGRGKISSMMGEVGKGITSFKRGMEDGRREIDETTVEAPGGHGPTVHTVRDVTPPHERAQERDRV
jgi:sec-independent protein translocase protein TatA